MSKIRKRLRWAFWVSLVVGVGTTVASWTWTGVNSVALDNCDNTYYMSQHIKECDSLLNTAGQVENWTAPEGIIGVFTAIGTGVTRIILWLDEKDQ